MSVFDILIDICVYKVIFKKFFLRKKRCYNLYFIGKNKEVKVLK